MTHLADIFSPLYMNCMKIFGRKFWKGQVIFTKLLPEGRGDGGRTQQLTGTRTRIVKLFRIRIHRGNRTTCQHTHTHTHTHPFKLLRSTDVLQDSVNLLLYPSSPVHYPADRQTGSDLKLVHYVLVEGSHYITWRDKHLWKDICGARRWLLIQSIWINTMESLKCILE